MLLCDATLPACFQANATWYPFLGQFTRRGPRSDLCSTCYMPGQRTFAPLGLPAHRLSEYLTKEDRQEATLLATTLSPEDLGAFQLDGIAVGEHALAGTLRFFGRASLEDAPMGEAVLRRYFEASVLTMRATQRLLTSTGFRSAVFHHGLYVPHGVIGAVCRDARVAVVNWGTMYRQRCLIFSHGDTYHRTLMAEPTESWERMPWTSTMENRLLAYLESRRHGSQDWIRVHDNPNVDPRQVAGELGLDFTTPCVGLLTNVAWEAQVHYPGKAFPDMFAWIARTVEYFAERPDLRLVIRVHPAELGRLVPSRQPVVEQLRRAFPTLPANVVLIPPESRISTYVVMERCNAVLIYGTKAGVELTALGVPVVTAGEAWVRGKGITIDPQSEPEYIEVLEQLPFAKRPDPAWIERARRYAYHFFFRRMIPIDSLDRPTAGSPIVVRASRLTELLPGCSVGLDVVCDGILDGAPFVYPAERIDAGIVVGAAGEC